ncbi:hypothetical protein GN316_12595 [Xylophilus sp. Kf1]|nr:hypothetical protein [Xylophilus sp. Kf1]
MNTESPPAPAPACGPSLEYEPDYLLLLARLAPGVEVQYGAFVGGQEAPDWGAIEHEARRLLARSQDIVLWVGVCRAAVRLRRAAGLADALAELNAALHRWPDAVHPQTWIDGGPDPVPRANALAALCDPQGLLADVRSMLALTPDGIQRAALGRAAAEWASITAWSARQLVHDAPDLQALTRLLAPFQEPDLHPTSAPAPAAGTALSVAGATRADMRAVLAQTRRWFEQHEPSSPVALLLAYAEQLVGKPFAELVDAIPPECLKKWQGVVGRGGVHP